MNFKKWLENVQQQPDKATRFLHHLMNIVKQINSHDFSQNPQEKAVADQIKDHYRTFSYLMYNKTPPDETNLKIFIQEFNKLANQLPWLQDAPAGSITHYAPNDPNDPHLVTRKAARLHKRISEVVEDIYYNHMGKYGGQDEVIRGVYQWLGQVKDVLANHLNHDEPLEMDQYTKLATQFRNKVQSLPWRNNYAS